MSCRLFAVRGAGRLCDAHRRSSAQSAREVIEIAPFAMTDSALEVESHLRGLDRQCDAATGY
jgi:hypothetical protein